jgi:endonuclease YncB( thermonuclease family)
MTRTGRSASSLWQDKLLLLASVSAAIFCGCAYLEAQANSDPRRLVGVTFSATVVSVIDDDTVRVALADASELRVRLEGIDCPETGEPYSTRACNATRALLFTRRVQVRGITVDRYARLVARIVVGDVDMSLELLKSGLACHFTRYSTDRFLAEAQREAQRKGLGFWSRGAPKPACALAALRPHASEMSGAQFHGNVVSHVFHSPQCRNYNCRHCTAIFASFREAEVAGFRPAGDCLR